MQEAPWQYNTVKQEAPWRYSTVMKEAPWRYCTITQEAPWQYCGKTNWQLPYDPYHSEFLLWWVDYVYLFSCTEKTLIMLSVLIVIRVKSALFGQSQLLMQSAHKYFFNQSVLCMMIFAICFVWFASCFLIIMSTIIQIFLCTVVSCNVLCKIYFMHCGLWNLFF